MYRIGSKTRFSNIDFIVLLKYDGILEGSVSRVITPVWHRRVVLYRTLLYYFTDLSVPVTTKPPVANADGAP